MYRGKSIQTPQTLFEIRRGGWLSTVLHLWTRGVALPVFELRLAGLPGVLGTWEDYYHPVPIIEDSILDVPPPLSDGGGVPAVMIDPSSGEIYTFCGVRWGSLPGPVLPEQHSGDDVPCGLGISVENPSATGTLGRFGRAKGSRNKPNPHRGDRNAVRRSRRDERGEAPRVYVEADATPSHPPSCSTRESRRVARPLSLRAALSRLSHRLTAAT
jgi:hypothetical protein